MQLSDLTADEQAQLAAFFTVYRPILGQISRVFASLAHVEDAWAGGISALVAQLDDGAIASPGSSMAGAMPLTKQSVTDTLADFSQAMASFNADANRQRYIAAAGLANTL